MSQARAETSEHTRFSCPLYGFQEMINGKYKLRIIWILHEGPRRYSEIKRSLLRDSGDSQEEIAPRVLSRELKTLTNLGWIERKEYAVMPPKVEYSLTEIGQSLIPAISSLHQWGLHYLIGSNSP